MLQKLLQHPWARAHEIEIRRVAGHAVIPLLLDMVAVLSNKPQPGPGHLNDGEGFDHSNWTWFTQGYNKISQLPTTSLSIHSEAAHRILLHSSQLPEKLPSAVARVLEDTSGFSYQRKHKAKLSDDETSEPQETQETGASASHRLKDPDKATLNDGSAWQASDNVISFSLPMRRSGVTANDLLNKANLQKHTHYAWRKDQKATWWLQVPVQHARIVLEALKSEYPDLYAAGMNAVPVWETRAPQPQAIAQPEQEAPVEVNPRQGQAFGVSWDWNPDNDKYKVALLYNTYFTPILRRAGVSFDFDRRGNNGEIWWFKTPVTQVARAIEVMGNTKFEKFARENLIPAWTEVKSALKQSKEIGETEEGSWRLNDGQVELFTMYKPSAVGWQPSFVEGRRIDGKFFWLFPESKARKVAKALESHYPRLAEALYRAFGGIATMAETQEEEDRWKALIEMSNMPAPNAKTPQAQQALAYVADKLRTRLPLGLSLMPFQMVGVAYAKLSGYRCIIGDDQGVGKTIQAIATLLTDPEELLPVLIVCPASVFQNWQKELAHWAPSLPVYPLPTAATRLPARGWRGVLICSWAMLSEFETDLRNWGLRYLIADEAHYAKEPTSLRAKAANALSNVVPHVVFLSGTPLKNRAVELWHLLHMVDGDAWGAKQEFGEVYGGVKTYKTKSGRVITKYEDGKNLDKLRARLRTFLIRRLKLDVLTQLPPKVRKYVDVVLTPKERAEYTKVKEEYETWLREEHRKLIEAEFRAEGVDPASATDEIKSRVEAKVESALRARALTQIGVLRHTVGRLKTRAALAFIQEMVDNDKPLVVVVNHRDVATSIAEWLTAKKIPYGMVVGGMAVAKKQEAVDAFQAGDLDVMIISESGKEGINLFRASNTLFVERFWTPADEDQAEDRIHRIGQQNGVTIWYLKAKDTIDEDVSNLIANKRRIIKDAIGINDIVSSIAGTTGSAGDVIRTLIRAVLTGKSIPKETPNPSRVESLSFSEKVVMPPTDTIREMFFAKSHWSAAAARYHAQYVMLLPVLHMRHLEHTTVIEVAPARDFIPGSFHSVALTNGVKLLVGKRSKR